jgi:DNA polymerase-3 subunit delta'
MSDNWDLLGHEWAVSLLQKHLSGGRLRHAYLFCGPDGIGRRTLALRFAQVLNHPDHRYDPDHSAAKQIARLQYPDLNVVQRQEGDRDIKIDAVRGLQQMLSLSPYMSERKIALLLDFELASDGASNALLKTLEEPPGRTILLMTAESPDSLLPTIVSRCEVLLLRPMNLAALADGLAARFGIEPDLARLAAHVSGGRPGSAVHLVQSPDALDQRARILDDLHRLLGSGRVARFQYANEFYGEKELLVETLSVWLTYWRDILLQTTGSLSPLINLDRQQEIGHLGGQLDTETSHRAALAVERKLQELRTNIEPRLAAESLMLELPTLKN